MGGMAGTFLYWPFGIRFNTACRIALATDAYDSNDTRASDNLTAVWVLRSEDNITGIRLVSQGEMGAMCMFALGY